MHIRHWVSCRAFTVRVHTTPEGMIVWAAPVVRKFTGQPISNLLAWAAAKGGLRHELMGVVMPSSPSGSGP
jgi:hypothetical protein